MRAVPADPAVVLQVFDDPIVLGILVGVLLLIFFLYLMVRRTILGFFEGMEETKRR
jgi:hypothetical protein